MDLSQQSFAPTLPDLLIGAIGDRPEREFTALTDAAARLLECPVSLLSLIDGDRQWVKAQTGYPAEHSPAAHDFCRRAVAQDSLLVIDDKADDIRFAAEPRIVGLERVRFYAGQPVHVSERGGRRIAVGTLSVFAPDSRVLSAGDEAILEGLARTAGALLEARIAAQRSASLADRLHQTLAARNRLHRSLAQAERMAKIGSWRLVLDGRRVEWSDQVYAIHEVPLGQSEALDDALQFYLPHDRPMIEEAIATTIQTGIPYDLEVDFVTARGRLRRVRSMGEIELEGGEPVALIGVFQDITEKYQLQQTLEAHANTDELTRIASRRHFKRVAEERLAQARKDGRTAAMALIDLDHFKTVNDRMGHAAGDAVLVRTAGALVAPWLHGSFAARLGGDEFVLLIDDEALMESIDVTVRRLLTELRQPQGMDDLTVSATVGVATASGERIDLGAMLAAADSALYRAKEKERGTAMLDGNGERRWISPMQSTAAE